MKPQPLARLQANLLTGLAVLLPAVISIAVVVWLFGTVSNVTDKLLFAVPRDWKYVNGVRGDIHWYWSLAALLFGLGLVTLIGRLARHYLGRKLIETGDSLLLRVPLLNRIYSTVKQVKEAIAGNKSSFREVVLVEFPHPGMYSLGFITSDQQNELQVKTPEQVWSVFVPTTPNPTTGFLIFVPISKTRRLDMSVADAIKTIISLGAITPDYAAGQGQDRRARQATSCETPWATKA
jgi:uncharacterized membrane protein